MPTGGPTTCNIISFSVETFVWVFSGLVHVIGALFGCILHAFYSFVMLLEPVWQFFCCFQHLCPFIGVYFVYSIAPLQYHSKAFQGFTTIAL